MSPDSNAVLLRLYLNEEEWISGRPLYEVVLRKAREMHVKGLALLRGPRKPDFGQSRRPSKLLTLLPRENLPVIVEVVDRPEPVRALLDSISPLIRHGLATVQDVHAWSYDEGQSSDDRWLKDDPRLLR